MNTTLQQHGLLAQSVERGADNAKVVSSSLTQTNFFFFFAFATFFVHVFFSSFFFVQQLQKRLAHTFNMICGIIDDSDITYSIFLTYRGCIMPNYKVQSI